MIGCPEKSVRKSGSAPRTSRNNADKMLILGTNGMEFAFSSEVLKRLFLL